MDESVKVCLEQPPVCIWVPVKVVIFGITIYVIWKFVEYVINGEKSDASERGR